MTLLAIVVKASALLAGAAILEALLWRRGSAAARHMVWTIAMAALLVLPLASAGLPEWDVRIPVAPRVTAAVPEVARVQVRSAPTSAAESVPASMAAAPPARERGPGLIALAIAAYAAGVLLLLTRLAVEQISLLRLARASRRPISTREWRQLLEDASQQLGIPRRVRLLQSDRELMPMAFGVRRPTVVLPASADTWTDERRRAVLLHELAHIARQDCLTQMLAAVACAAYWPHPAVWWGARRLRVERELACDDRVLAAGTEPRAYAGHLLDIAHSLGSAPAPAIALGMARARQLENRLLAVLDAARNRAHLERRGRLVAAALAVIVVLPIAALRAAVVTPAAPAEWPELHTSALAFVQAAASATDLTGTWEVRPARQAGSVQVTVRTAHGSHSSTVSAARVESLAGQAIPANGPVHFKIQRDAGTFTGDGTCRNSVCGGTFGFEASAAFAAELAKRGVGAPTAEQQLALAIADVGVAYLDGLTAAGYKAPDVATLVRAAQHGVSVPYVQRMASLGYRLGTLDDVIRLRDHGVDPEFVQGLAENGFAHLSSEELLRARDHGVDPQYVKGMRDLGLAGSRIDDLITSRDHGIDPEYARGMQAHGFGVSHDELVRARDHGVDPEYAERMAALGYKGVPLEQLIRTRDHGVDSQYVSDLAELGYKGLTLDELIRLRDHGVDAKYVRRVQEKGLGHLSVDELIRRRDRGADDPSVQARETIQSLKAWSWWQALVAWWRG